MMVPRDLPHKQEGYANEDAAFTQEHPTFMVMQIMSVDVTSVQWDEKIIMNLQFRKEGRNLR
jgi:hypothetical protein